MSCSTGDKADEYLRQFGTNVLGMLGFSSDAIGGKTREQMEQDKLQALQDQYQDIINTSFLAYAQAVDKGQEDFFVDMNASLSVTSAFMQNSNLSIMNQIKLQQVLVIGIYALFIIIYFYLIFFT